MIVNIIDHRLSKYRYLKINAIVEAAWRDNSVMNADRQLPEKGGPDYAQKEHTSLAEAIQWATTFAEPVTLYLYDEDDGIYLIKGHDEKVNQRRK